MSLGFNVDGGSVGTDGDRADGDGGGTVNASTGTTDDATINIVTSTTDTTSTTPATDGGNVAGAEEGSSTLNFTAPTKPFHKQSIPVVPDSHQSSSRGRIFQYLML